MRNLPRPAILRPLARRDFALLFTARTASLLGDGVYVVAVAWQVYTLENAPAALAIVGLGLAIPQVSLVLFGGVLTDRLQRRRVLVAADVLRAVAIGTLGVLAVSGALELWHVVALVVLVGAGDALFNPAYTAIVPELVAGEDLVRANGLDQFVRPLAIRLVGPVLGGAAVAGLGAGAGFLFDAGTFLASAAAVLAIRTPTGPATAREGRSGVLADAREGLRYVRSQTWLWACLLTGALSLLCFWGPFEVLLPYVVKNRLGGAAADFAAVLAAGGAGAIVAAIVVGQRGLPRHPLRFAFACFTLMISSLIAYGLVAATWQAMAVYCVAYALNAALMVVWGTLIQTLVPRELLGRVASLDSLISFGLVPLSFALTGPVAAALGAQATLIGAGVLGAAASVAVWLLVPGLRRFDRQFAQDAAGAAAVLATTPERGEYADETRRKLSQSRAWPRPTRAPAQ